MGTFTGQAFISSNIDCGIWLSSLIQESVEIGIVFQTGIINLMWGGVQCSISRIKILCRDGFEINEFHNSFNRDSFQGYLDLFSFAMNPPSDPLEKVDLLLNLSFKTSKTLRYRDLFSWKPRD